MDNYDAYSYLFRILYEKNSWATISLSTGEYLNKLMKDCNGVLGIQRANIGKIDYIDGIPIPDDIMSKDLYFKVDPKDFYQSDNCFSPKYIIGVIIKENNKFEFYSLEQLTNVNNNYK